jgi:hypothetical protein
VDVSFVVPPSKDASFDGISIIVPSINQSELTSFDVSNSTILSPSITTPEKKSSSSSTAPSSPFDGTGVEIDWASLMKKKVVQHRIFD